MKKYTIIFCLAIISASTSYASEKIAPTLNATEVFTILDNEQN